MHEIPSFHVQNMLVYVLSIPIIWLFTPNDLVILMNMCSFAKVLVLLL